MRVNERENALADVPPFQHKGGVRSLKIKQQRGGTESYIWNLDSSANYSDGVWQIGQTRLSANMVSFTKIFARKQTNPR